MSSKSDFIDGICYNISNKYPSLTNRELNRAIDNILKDNPINYNRKLLSLHTEYYFLLQKECEKIIIKRKYIQQLIRIIGKVMILYNKHNQTTCTNTDPYGETPLFRLLID